MFLPKQLADYVKRFANTFVEDKLQQRAELR
jgi:hypothetical protein